MVGLFTRKVPALGPKVVIVFHIIAYGLFQFVLSDIISIHFLHLYAILFFVEVGIMLVIGHFRPRAQAWTYQAQNKVDMSPWRFAIPCAVTLMSSVIAVYLLFSPIGLVDGLSAGFWPLIWVLIIINALAWWWTSRRDSVPIIMIDD
jgi:SSS family solute:Na+ symporter